MIVYLDLDGVLAKCHESALEFWNVDSLPWDTPMHAIVNHRFRYDMPRDDFWDNFGYDFWAELPKTDLCDRLIETSCRMARQVFILSAPTGNPESASGKLRWLKANSIDVPYILTSHKYLLSKPGSILVDDNFQHTNRFLWDKGESILVPRPWNGSNHNDQWVLDTLSEKLQ